MRDLCDDNIFDLKTGVDIWLRMNVVTVEYLTLAHMSHLIIWLFQSVTEIYFRRNGVKWGNVDLFYVLVFGTN